MKHNIIPVGRRAITAAFAVFLAIPTLSAQAQISITGAYSENFNTTPGTSGTAVPTGWTLVSGNATASALSLSDSIWAGTASGVGYNAALQTDITQTGDSLPDRGLSIYATSTNTEVRNITATFRNDTSNPITSLAVASNAVLYAARFDSTSTNKRWDGFKLQYSVGAGAFTSVSPTLQASFTNALVTFSLDGGDPWTTGNGWATALTIPGGNKKPMNASITVAIPAGSTFKLRWLSNGGPSLPSGFVAGDQKNMNIGVDDISITPAFAPVTAVPVAPSGLLATVVNSSKIQLAWTDNSTNETGFKIERSPDGVNSWTVVTTTAFNVTSYLDTGLTQLTPYFYRITAVNGIGDSAPTTTMSATTIADSPGSVRFAPDIVSVAENVVSGTVTLNVERIGDSDGAVSVDYQTFDNSALAGSDYTAATGTLNWANGDESVKTITVAIINDTEVEAPEVFSVALSNPTNGLAIVLPDTAYVTINSEDAYGTIKFSSTTYSATEASGTVTITAQRTAGSSGAVSIDYGTSDGTAVAGTNYTATSGTLNWADGDTVDKTFTVTLIDNALAEKSKTFNVSLSNPGGGATLGSPATATVSIINDDPGFALLDNFSSGTVGNAAPGWSQNVNTTDTQFFTQVDPANAANQVGGLTRVSANTGHSYYLPLGADAIPDGATGTLFMRFRLAGGPDTDKFNTGLGLSDVTTVSANGSDFETQATVSSSGLIATSALAVSNAGTGQTVGTMNKNTWYNIWFVANNATDTYDVYLNTGIGGANATNRVATGITFRNGLASNSLRNVQLILFTGTTLNLQFYVDDVYLDRTGQNLANPAPNQNAAEQWRQTYFGSPLNTGNGANGSDFDNDSSVNLLERAFNTIPNDSASSYFPVQSIVTDNGVVYLAITYRQPTGGFGVQGVDYTVNGIRYTVENDDDLVAPWSSGGLTSTLVSVSTPVAGVETVTVRLNTPISAANKRFIRLNVTDVNP